MQVEIIAGWLNPEEVIGTLNILKVHGRESMSVMLEQEWADRHAGLFLDPDIFLYSGIQYPPDEKEMFGMLSDSSPDRWGRKLIEREARNRADTEHRQIRTLNGSDYLLSVSDKLRYGGLRFRDKETGRYFSQGSTDIPPITKIRTLESAVREYELSENDRTVLRLILDPGSSLGGARPKANVIDTDGSLWIAKFPSKKDDYNIGAWEMTEHDLAVQCGLIVPNAKIMKLSPYGSTFLTKRFDRDGDRRIHLMSAMTALGMTDGHTEGVGYLDIAAQTEQASVSPQKDLRELWRRMAFNILTSNCDDHLRNHGFILEKDGWHLSPAYDLNPNIDKTDLSLMVTENDNRKNINNAISVSEFFRLSGDEASEIAEDMQNTIRENWKDFATAYGLSEKDTQKMSRAFEECNTPLQAKAYTYRRNASRNEEYER